MGIVAMLSCGAAYYFYPKVYRESGGSRLNQPLFESYENSNVRYIKIDRFDPEKNGITKLHLALVGGRWVIPAKNNFPAGNAARVAAAIDCLKDRNILEEVSDQQQDHEEYGVVELTMATDGEGTGTTVTLEDRNHQPIGSLIVGEPTKNAGKALCSNPWPATDI